MHLICKDKKYLKKKNIIYCSCCSGRVKSKRLTCQFTHRMTHISVTRLEYLQISRQNFHVKWLFKLPHVLPKLCKGKQIVPRIPMAEQCIVLFFFMTEPRQIWAAANVRLRNRNNQQPLLGLADIQECYEVTLQLNKEEAAVKNNSRADVWEVAFFFSPHLFKIIKHMLGLCLIAMQNAFFLALFMTPCSSLGPCRLNFLFPLTSFSQRRLRSHCLVSYPGQQGAWSLLSPSLSGSQLLLEAWAQSYSERVKEGEVGAVGGVWEPLNGHPARRSSVFSP